MQRCHGDCQAPTRPRTVGDTARHNSREWAADVGVGCRHGFVSLGDIAGMIAALAFAFLVFRLGSVIGKAGKILDETRVSLRTTTENVQPTLLKLTDTVSLTNEQLARVDGITTNVSAMTTNASALTVALRGDARQPGGQGRGLHLRRPLGPRAEWPPQAQRPSPPQGLITVARLFWVGAGCRRGRLRRAQGQQGRRGLHARRASAHGLADFGDGLRELAAAVREGMAEREGELRLALGIDAGTADDPRPAPHGSTPQRRGPCSTTPRARERGTSALGALAHPRRPPRHPPSACPYDSSCRAHRSHGMRLRTEYSMETAEIRRRFLSFFESKGHTVVPSVTAGLRRPQPAVRQRRHGAVQALLPRASRRRRGTARPACRSASAPVTSRRSARPPGTARSSR